jgi:hypothetical protein
MDALGDKLKMPCFELLCEHLKREQYKFMQLDCLTSSKNQALLSQISKGWHKVLYK